MKLSLGAADVITGSKSAAKTALRRVMEGPPKFTTECGGHAAADFRTPIECRPHETQRHEGDRQAEERAGSSAGARDRHDGAAHDGAAPLRRHPVRAGRARGTSTVSAAPPLHRQ